MFTKLILEDTKNNLIGLKSRELVLLNCICCGLDFSKPKNYIQGKIAKGQKAIFCSKSCSDETVKVEILVNCKYCNKPTEFPKNFCGHSCSALFNNSLRKKKVKNKCVNCGSDCRIKFCSRKCSFTHRYQSNKNSWLNGEENVPNDRLRNYLTEIFGYKCSVCKIEEWNGLSITLEVEHRNGNSEDSSLENVCLICPNCHSQTSTYKAKNKGNGRHVRRQRYQEGKSY